MRILLLAATLGAAAVLPATAASAHPHPRGNAYGHYDRETREELRECRRELRRADSRREYRRELRECRHELRDARRDDRYSYRYRDRWDDDRYDRRRYSRDGRYYWDGYTWRRRW
jgi:hypothetical protein